MNNIENIIESLIKKQNEIKEELDICKKSKENLKNAIFSDSIYEIDNLTYPISLIKKYDFVKFLESKYTKEEIMKLLEVLCKDDLFITRNIISKSSEKLLKNVNMNGTKFKDFDSYMNCLTNIYYIISFFSKLKINNKKYNIKSNTIRSLIISFYFNLSDVLNKLCKKLINMSNKYDVIIELLEEILKLNVQTDYEAYEELVLKYSKLIRNNDIFQNDELQSLNSDLRNTLRAHKIRLEKENRKKENSTLKIGTREERKIQHEKIILENKINELKSELTVDSKIYVDLIIEQINNLDKNSIDKFLEFLYSYLIFETEQSKIIIETVVTELEFKDADENVIDALKKTLGR